MSAYRDPYRTYRRRWPGGRLICATIAFVLIVAGVLAVFCGGCVGDKATQKTGQVVADTEATANVSVKSALGVGAIVLVVVVLTASGWLWRGFFGMVRLVLGQSHERALLRLNGAGRETTAEGGGATPGHEREPDY